MNAVLCAPNGWHVLLGDELDAHHCVKIPLVYRILEKFKKSWIDRQVLGVRRND